MHTLKITDLVDRITAKVAAIDQFIEFNPVITTRIDYHNTVGRRILLSNEWRELANEWNSRYRTIFLKRFIQGLVFKGILKGQESKSWDFFEGPRRFRGPQKSEKFNFLKRTNKSVDHKFKYFAIN